MSASVCVLSYERPHLLRPCLESLREAGEPFELIVHDDGSKDPEVLQFLHRLHESGLISTLILAPPEHNEGVGEAVRRMFAVAQGDLLVKVDQDLVFVEGWLARARKCFEDEKLGCLGLFPYHHDPCDVEKTAITGGDQGTHFYVEDFVGSAFLIPRSIYELPAVGPIESHADAFSEDVGLKMRIRTAGYELGLTDEAQALNVGFGIGPSTVNLHQHDDGRVDTQGIEHGPLLMPGTWS